MSYAEGTNVPPEKSQQEISQIVKRYGASGFVIGWDEDRAAVAFTAHGRQVRFTLEMPPASSPMFAKTPTGRTRDAAARKAAAEAEIRRRWRTLVLAIKAKLEIVSTGVVSFEEEFLAHIVLPDGSTVGSSVRPAITEAYESGRTPALLPGVRAIGS